MQTRYCYLTSLGGLLCICYKGRKILSQRYQRHASTKLSLSSCYIQSKSKVDLKGNHLSVWVNQYDLMPSDAWATKNHFGHHLYHTCHTVGDTGWEKEHGFTSFLCHLLVLTSGKSLLYSGPWFSHL